MSSSTLNPIGNPQAWDRITIGQVQSPGCCELSGFVREYEWDVKKGKGTLGATSTFVGKPPVEGSIKFKLWLENDFIEWDDFRKLLQYDPTKKQVAAIDIYHPSLADIGLTAVQVKKIGAIVHEGQQMYSITVDFMEYCPPPKKSAVSTANGAKTTQKGTTPGTPIDPVEEAKQREIAALLKKASEP